MSAMKPSARITFTQQSNDPLYFTASPDVIIMRRRIVSIGYEIRPDVIVTTSHVQYTLSSWQLSLTTTTELVKRAYRQQWQSNSQHGASLYGFINN